MTGRKWVLPAWEGPDSPQTPVPTCGHEHATWNPLAQQMQCPMCRDRWTEKLHGAKDWTGEPVEWESFVGGFLVSADG